MRPRRRCPRSALPCRNPGQHLPAGGSGPRSPPGPLSRSRFHHPRLGTGRNGSAGRSSPAAAALSFPRWLRQRTARLETSPTVITRQINGQIPDGRVAPIHGSSSPSQRSRQGEDKPCFQGPALQITHHCHRTRSCLGPKHRRLIKVYCRFSPIFTLSLWAGKHRAGSDLRGCSTASLASAASAAPFRSSPSPRKTCRPQRRRGQKRAPNPHPTVPGLPDGGRWWEHPWGETVRGPTPAPAKSRPSLGRVGWHRFIGLSGNSPVYTAEESLNG